MPKPSTHFKLNPSPKSVLTTPKAKKTDEKSTNTSEINAKATSPTLIEFQNKNAQLPEWRLQLKNAVQQRLAKNYDYEGKVAVSDIESTDQTSAKSFRTSGGNALRAEIVEVPRQENIYNEQLANALKRIENSRRKYYIVEEIQPIEIPEQEQSEKEYPFTIATRNNHPLPEKSEDLKTSVNFPVKPKLVPKKISQKTADLYDTSELDPNFIPAKISSSFTKEQPKPELNQEKPKIPKTQVQTTKIIEEIEKEIKSIETVETDDIAPIALRFNSGLFDLIIGSFSSMFLLTPFMFLGGNWFSIAGFFAFLATCAIVMFIYLTTTVGLFGKTFGMHLFKLEMVDYFDDGLPTFHQAAVSSSIYLLSLAFCGLGFITTIFDEDKRAIHDLVSGTLIVKEL